MSSQGLGKNTTPELIAGLAAALRRLGHDVLTAIEAGQAGQRIEDHVVLDFASPDPLRPGLG